MPEDHLQSFLKCSRPEHWRPPLRGRQRVQQRHPGDPQDTARDRAHLDLLLKLLDLPFQGLHVGDEGHCVGGAGRVHRVLLQLLAGLWAENMASIRSRGGGGPAALPGSRLLTLEIWEWNSVMLEPSICPNLLSTSLCQESYFRFTFDWTCGGRSVHTAASLRSDAALTARLPGSRLGSPCRNL